MRDEFDAQATVMMRAGANFVAAALKTAAEERPATWAAVEALIRGGDYELVVELVVQPIECIRVMAVGAGKRIEVCTIGLRQVGASQAVN